MQVSVSTKHSGEITGELRSDKLLENGKFGSCKEGPTMLRDSGNLFYVTLFQEILYSSYTECSHRLYPPGAVLCFTQDQI